VKADWENGEGTFLAEKRVRLISEGPWEGTMADKNAVRNGSLQTSGRGKNESADSRPLVGIQGNRPPQAGLFTAREDSRKECEK